MAYTTEEIAEAFADATELQCSPSDENADFERLLRINRTTNQLKDEDNADQITPVTPKEIMGVLAKVKTRKIPGYEGIPTQALKLLPRRCIAALVNTCNAMLRIHHFPSQ